MARASRTLQALVAGHVVAGTTALLVVLASTGDRGLGPAAEFLLLLAGLVAARVVPLPVPRGEQLEDVEVEEPFLVAMLVLLPATGVVTAVLVAAVVGNLARRRAWNKVLFNIGMSATAAALAVGLRAVVVGLAGTSTAAVSLAALLGGLFVVVYEIGNVYAVIAAASRRSFGAVARESLGIGVLVSASGMSVGLALGVATMAAWWAPLTLLMPGVVILILLKNHLQAVRDRHRLNGLLRAATHAHASVEVRAVTEAVLTSARSLLRAGSARLADAPPGSAELGAHILDGEAERWLVVGDRHHLDPFERGEQQLLEGLATIGSAALSNAHLVQRAEHQAVHDPLTGLPNRLLFEDRVSQAAARGARFGEKFAVLFLDIDRFKRVNDSLGHSVGDEILRAAAHRLSDAVRAVDTVARVGGDEFSVLLPGIATHTESAVVTNAILEAMRAPLVVNNRQLFVTASVGIALFPDHGVDHDALMAHADAALLRAKERGRDTSEIYGVDVTTKAAPLLQLEGQLHHAIERGQIWVAYQPLIDLRRGRVTGAEALVRWTHPTLGELSPDEFLPVAEESGLVAQLDTFVLLTACRQAARWNIGRSVAERMHVAVNFSARQLHTASVVDIVTDALAATGLPAELLEIEISERLAGRDSPEVSEVLARLRESGVRVAIDDFGTGYSALSRLDRFPLDNVKIDKSFVSRIVKSGDNAPIVVATIAMAHGLGLTVTAEGVETVAQLDFLRGHGCDVVQGYLLGRPKGGDGVPRSQLELLEAVSEVVGTQP